MKYSHILSSVSLFAGLGYSRTFIGSLYEDPDECEYTNEYPDGYACDSLDIGVCCYKDDSLWGSGEIITEDVGNPSDYLAPIYSKQGEVDDNHPGSTVYCAAHLTTVRLNSCSVGGNLQVVGGVSFEGARAMDKASTEEDTGNNDAHQDEVTQAEESKGRAQEARGFKPPTKGVQAEIALFGPDFIYIISDLKLAELEAQGLGRPENKEERIEWFKKYHTIKRKNTGPRLARRYKALFNVIDAEIEWRKAEGQPPGFSSLLALKPIVAMGADHPLEEEALAADHLHGEDGLHGVHESFPHLAPAETWEELLQEGADDQSALFTPSNDLAYREILRILRENPPDTITIAALGPLTNIALAASEDAETFLRVKELVVMGVTVSVSGNITPVAEFNTYADAVAAAQVYALTSPSPQSTMPVSSLPDYTPRPTLKLPMKLFPLDLTSPHRLY